MARGGLVAAAAVAAVVAAALLAASGALSPPARTVTLTVTEARYVTETVTVTEARALVVDALGRLVEVPRAERVVSLAPSITEIVCALGCCGRLVGVDAYSNYPPEVAEAVEEGRVAVVGGYWNPDPERIVALEPDVVLASSSVPAHRALAEVVDAAVVYLRAGGARSFEDVYADIALVDAALGCPADAEDVIESVRSRVEAVRARLEGAEAVPVLVLLGVPEWGVWAAGGGTFIDAVVTAAGGSNVASRLHGWVMLGPEELASMRPRVVLVALMAADAPSAEAALGAWRAALAEAGLEYERICVLWGPANDVVTRPGPRLGQAVELVASILHPDLVEPPEGLSGYVLCG